MGIPFTVEQFFSVFESYNRAIWPAQIVAYVLGLAVVAALVRRSSWSARFTTGTLALFWIWMGAVYHIAHFSTINPAARIFGVLFIVQGVILAIHGVILNRLDFGHTGRLNVAIGSLFIVFAMLIYPILGYLFGHRYPAVPMFGVTPCPATVFTFGVFLFARTRVPWYLFILPLLWSLVGMSAAINLRVPQDYGLVIAGIVGTVIILVKNREGKKRPNQSLQGTTE
jgi:hypothetical protein